MSVKKRLLMFFVIFVIFDDGKGLELSIERFSEQNFCGRLHCSHDVIKDRDIFSITGMIIYDVTDSESKLGLASVSLTRAGLFVEQDKSNDINGTGNISRYQAELTLDFGKEKDCLYRSFQCELDFVNVNGHMDLIRKTLTSEYLNNGCSCDSVMSQMTRITTSHDKLEKELTELRYNSTVIGGELSEQRDNITIIERELSVKNSALEEKLTKILQQNSVLETQMNNFSQKFDSIERVLNSHATCRRGEKYIDGDRKLILLGMKVAMCDTVTDGGGWIIIQRRTKGDVDFYRGWSDYKKGFGTPDTDFWIGNDVIHNLTSRGYTELRIDLEYKGSKYFAHYSNFNVGDEVSKYKLSVSGYSGTANDSLAYHDGMKFSTFDQDNDLDSWNCADVIGGAWWYNLCFFESSINGKWGRDGRGGVVWSGVIYNTFVSSTEMKMRHV